MERQLKLFLFLTLIFAVLSTLACGKVWVTLSNSPIPGTPVEPFVQSAQIFRSVGPANVSVLACGGTDGSGCANVAGSLAISGTVATFNSALPLNIGVGDVIVYDSSGNNSLGAGDSVAFIFQINSSSVYTIQNASGGTPTAYSSGTVWRIYRAYTSLANAITGNHSENSSIIAINAALGYFDAGFNNNNNLVTLGLPWTLALYADAVDSSAFNTTGWVTSPAKYLKIYAPYIAADVGATQRHSGLWDATKATFNTVNNFDSFNVTVDRWVDGLQIEANYGAISNSIALDLLDNSTATMQKVSNNIVMAVTAGTSNNSGIGVGNSATTNAYIWNNMVSGFNAGGSGSCIALDGGTGYLYNNTAVNCSNGIYGDGFAGATTFVAKNNIVQGGTTNYFLQNAATFSASSRNNISSDLTAPGSNAITSGTVTFVNPGIHDYRLSSSDTVAKNAGVTLSSDANLSFLTDISNINRPQEGAWDIGCSEAP